MKYYRMAIENIKTKQRDTYVSRHQGAAPAGWRCVGVLGYFEKPGKRETEAESEVVNA